jgi:hypothetical protein
VLLRALSFVYLVAFAILVQQHAPLLGSRGLLPATLFLERVEATLGSKTAGFERLPSLFWLTASDTALSFCAWLGLSLSLLGCFGFGNACVFAVLWALYLSFVHVGQIFYGYGWESLLCEAGFLAIFLVSPTAVRFGRSAEPPAILIVLFRWLTFRVMFGAGLIKLRGDPCWLDLSCLVHHYETQPNPNPLSPWLHRMPRVFHQGGVLVNHAVELIAPFGVFGPRRLRYAAGLAIVGFQCSLIASGNLSFLNWLTIALALSCFDDAAFARVAAVADKAIAPARRARSLPPPPEPGRAFRYTSYALAVSIGALSLNPIVNLLSPRQAMNASFDPLKIVNTYGAFGSVGRVRHEVVFEGTAAANPDERARWLEYEFPCKPGNPRRRPCLISPYHYRLDWQLWFLAMGRIEGQPWALHLVHKLLVGDRSIESLLQVNPFPEAPPRWIRARYYTYRYAEAGADRVWDRELVGTFMRPVSRGDPELVNYLRGRGLIE